MSVAVVISGGLLVSGAVFAIFLLARPLRSRPRPSPDVTAARYRWLRPLVTGVIVVLGVALAAALISAAI